MKSEIRRKNQPTAIFLVIFLLIIYRPSFIRRSVALSTENDYSFEIDDWLVWKVSELSIIGEDHDYGDAMFSENSLEYYNISAPYVREGDLARYHILNVSCLYYDLYIRDIKVDDYNAPTSPSMFGTMYPLSTDWKAWLTGSENLTWIENVLEEDSIYIWIDWLDSLENNSSTKSNETLHHITQHSINRSTGLLTFYELRIINKDIDITYRLEFVDKLQYDPSKRNSLISIGIDFIIVGLQCRQSLIWRSSWKQFVV
ncbi:MAG: hypothetical protein ACW98I_19975 [Candidatus Hodarchaeales archaeon]|jgi:hypothetical protein